MFVCPSVCMFVCLSVRPSVCIFICLSVCLSVCNCLSVSVCLSVCMFVYLSVYLFVCTFDLSRSVHLFVCLYVCLFASLSICLFVCLSICLIENLLILQDGAPLTSLIKIGPNIDVQLAPENAEVCHAHPSPHLMSSLICLGISATFISRSKRNLI